MNYFSFSETGVSASCAHNFYLLFLISSQGKGDFCSFCLRMCVSKQTSPLTCNSSTMTRCLVYALKHFCSSHTWNSFHFKNVQLELGHLKDSWWQSWLSQQDTHSSQGLSYMNFYTCIKLISILFMVWGETVHFFKVSSVVFIVPLDGTRFGPQDPARAELLPKNWTIPSILNHSVFHSIFEPALQGQRGLKNPHSYFFQECKNIL